MSSKKEQKVLHIKTSPKKLSVRESISRLENLILEEQTNGNKRAVDSLRRVVECLKKREKES